MIIRNDSAFLTKLPLGPAQLSFPFRNRSNSDLSTLQPFPALVPLILPAWRYFTKVGLEIRR